MQKYLCFRQIVRQNLMHFRLLIKLTVICVLVVIFLSQIQFHRYKFVYNITEDSRERNGNNLSIHSYLTHSPTLAIFIIIDSTKFDETSDILNMVKKYAAEEPFIHECNENNFCHVHLVFYADDKKTDRSEFRDGVYRIFYPVDKATNNEQNTVTHYITNRQQDARVINDVMMTSYINGADYFVLITSDQIVYEGRTGRTMQELIDEISNIHLHDIGTILFTKPLTPKHNSNLTGFFISKLHIEIFGEPFPYLYVSTVPIALEYLTRVYPKFMTKELSLSSKQIVMSKFKISSSQSLSEEFIKDQADILSRFLLALDNSISCLRCDIKKNNKVIAMSLFGSDPRYTYGAIRNAQLLPVIFPGWRLWFYTEKEPINGKRDTDPIPKNIMERIEELGAEFRYIDAAKTVPGLWRLSAMEELDIEDFIVRDSDSRLTSRDATVVSDWLKTDQPFHCIRDHPYHSNHVLNAGLWGGRPKRIGEIFNGSFVSDLKRFVTGFTQEAAVLGYMTFLVQEKYLYCHDSFTCDTYDSSVPFHIPRKGFEYIGQTFNEHSIARDEDIDAIKTHRTNLNCVPVDIVINVF